MNIAADLTSGRLLARNTLINLGGEVFPFLVGLVALPILIHAVGVNRYGIITLSAMVVGYFGLFDFGLGAAATKLIAEAAGSGDRTKVPSLFWTSLLLMFAFGTCGGVLAAAVSPWLVHHLFRISTGLQSGALHAFRLLAFSLPFVISAGSLRGTLAAFQRFDLINAVRVPMGVFLYIGPLLVLPFSYHLEYLVAVMVAGRLAAWLASLVLCLRLLPELRGNPAFSRIAVLPMLRFGGWVAVSQIVSPIMEYFDRFLIGAMLSMAAVAYYAVPYQVASKLWIVSAAIEGVAFAGFSSTFRTDPRRTALIFQRATLWVLFAQFPAVLAIVALAPEALRLWLGAEFARNSAGVLRWIAIGVFLNSLARMPSLILLAAHRPDLTAKIHLAEVPFYCLFLWWILPRYGVEGAAIAWTLRISSDMAAFFFLGWRLLPQARATIAQVVPLIAIAVLLLCAGFAFHSFAGALPFIAVVLASAAVGLWRLVLRSEEKALIRGLLRSPGTVAGEMRKSWF